MCVSVCPLVRVECAVAIAASTPRRSEKQRGGRLLYHETAMLCYVRKVKNSQARTGHQRGMDGRGTDDDDTLERRFVAFWSIGRRKENLLLSKSLPG